MAELGRLLSSVPEGAGPDDPTFVAAFAAFTAQHIPVRYAYRCYGGGWLADVPRALAEMRAALATEP
jgi:hypothetical protein